MPITYNTLFCQPSDIWDVLSVEGVDLRNDDSSLSSGQIISTVSDSPIGSTTIAVSPITAPLLGGTQLTFLQAGMPIPITVQLTAPVGIGSASLSVITTTADIPAGAQARDSGVNAATGARLVLGTRKGTSKVKLYCNSRYDDSELAKSGTVLDWTATVGSKFLCTRRAQGCPRSLAEQYDEVIEELRMVQSGQLAIEDIGTRGVDWPTVTNLTVNPSYEFMRSRVEPNMSEQTPTVYSQFIDWNSALAFEF